MPVWLEVFVRGVLAVSAIILLTRLQGLRSFSKMSSFDFSLTVAFGSVIAGSMLSTSTPIWIGIAALVTIFALQFLLTRARILSSWFESAVDNTPLLIMRDGEIQEDALASSGMTRSDLIAKLREANVLSFAQVHAVVFEATGDVSVLHRSDGPVDIETMLDGVKTR